ncbi:hypothetical protein Gpo141_00008957 [Globisporangium polare]
MKSCVTSRVLALALASVLLVAQPQVALAVCKSNFGDDSSNNDTSVGQEASLGGSYSQGSSAYASSSGSASSSGAVASSGSFSSSASSSGAVASSGSFSSSASSSGAVASSSSSSSSSSRSGAVVSSSSSSSSATDSGADVGQSSWAFKPVTSVQVRVQGNLPAWDADHEMFISSYGSDFDAKYIGVMDTVNTAAVEGAFKYVQAECINASVIINCTRKNSVKYIAFYETTIVQPRAAMAYYQNDTTGATAAEHCPFTPMDGGQCTPTNGVFPKMCDQYTGVNGQPKLGMCVGGTLQENELLAPYPNNYWFSYPNSCPRNVWANKTAACRKEQPGGICPFGVQPDGVTCTFSYKILGYISLDDVVGITSMVNPRTNAKYKDYAEFCNAGGIEYDVQLLGGLTLLLSKSIPFWSEPASRTRNTQRVQTLVNSYNALVSKNPKTADGGVMEALPSIAELTEKNPPCYENNVRCANAKYGCSRSLYSQVCTVCTASSSNCVVKPKGYTFPQL